MRPVSAPVPTAAAGGSTAPTGKRVAKCAQALAKAGTKFAFGEIKLVQACTAAVGKCVQEKPADAEVPAEGAPWLREAARQAERSRQRTRAKLAAAVAKSCGAAGLGTSDPDRRHRSRLWCSCRGLRDARRSRARRLAGIAECLQRQHACRAEQMLESRTPRFHELLDLGQVTLP